MKIALYIILFFIVILIYILLKRLRKNMLMTILCSTLIIYFIIYPKPCIDSTLAGVKIFFMSVFPSLFSFLVISNLLMVYDGISIYSKVLGKYLCAPIRLPVSCSFVIIVSTLCGYPLGAKYACDLYEKKLISAKTCERLLNIASNASPLFVIGAVGITMLKSSLIGYLLLISNYISCIIMGIVLPSSESFKHMLSAQRSVSHAEEKTNFGGALKNSIDNSIKTSLSIGGYITLFSVIIDIIKNNVIFNIVINNIPSKVISKDVLSGFLLGIVEITKGCYIIASSSSAIFTKIFIIGFFLGFSGISIITQVYSFTFRFPELSIKKYIRRKIVQGIVSGLVSAAGLSMLSGKLASHPAISTQDAVPSNIPLLVLLFLLSPIIVHNVKKLFHIT